MKTSFCERFSVTLLPIDYLGAFKNMPPDTQGTVSRFKLLRTIELVENEISFSGLVVSLNHESVTVPHYIALHCTCRVPKVLAICELFQSCPSLPDGICQEE